MRDRRVLPRYGEERIKMLQEAVDLFDQYGSIKEASESAQISYRTFQGRLTTARAEGITSKRYRKKPEKADIPPGISEDRKVIDIRGEHTVLIISDIHVPYHDAEALTIALDHGQKRKADIVLINGDFMDCEALSEHEKIPNQRYAWQKEISMAQEILSAIRKRFPDALILWNEGNHEYRFPRHLAKRTPDTYRRDAIPHEIKPEIWDVQFVYRETDIRLGRLSIVHGDEYKGGGSVNCAHALFRKALDNVLGGHFHRTQEHQDTTVKDKNLAAWTIGCLCYTHPSWLLKNKWNLGFAIVTLLDDGDFIVENKKIIKGRIY